MTNIPWKSCACLGSRIREDARDNIDRRPIPPYGAGSNRCVSPYRQFVMEKASEADIVHHQQNETRPLNAHLPSETASRRSNQCEEFSFPGGRIPPENNPFAVLTPPTPSFCLDHAKGNDNCTTADGEDRTEYFRPAHPSCF